jgi:hypothetical protein
MAAEFARLLKTKSRWSDQRLSGYLVRVLGYSRTGSDRTSRGRTGLRTPLDAATVSEKRHRVTQTDRKSFSPVAAARLARRQSASVVSFIAVAAAVARARTNPERSLMVRLPGRGITLDAQRRERMSGRLAGAAAGLVAADMFPSSGGEIANHMAL